MTEQLIDGPQLVAFSVHHSGNFGQQIIDHDGRTIAWTTDELVARVICEL